MVEELQTTALLQSFAQPLLKQNNNKSNKKAHTTWFTAVCSGMFGNNLKRIRKERGMTQRQLAALAEIHYRHVQDMEACLKIPSVAIAVRLHKALKCKLTDLTKGM